MSAIPGTLSAGKQAEITLHESRRGEFVLPTAMFELIADRLPACLQRNDDDAPPAAHYPRRPLVRKYSDRTYITTRNTGEVAQLLEDVGVGVQIHSHFDYKSCMLPACRAHRLLRLTKKCQADIAHLDDEAWERLTFLRYGQLVAGDKRQKYDLAALLCTAFPDVPAIVFVVASKREREQVARELERRLLEPVHRAGGIYASAESRIVVATYWSARSENLRDAPFWVLPCWRPGLPRWIREVIWRAYADRVVLLRTSSEILSEGDEDGLLGRLGPVIWQPAATPSTLHTFSLFYFGGQPAEAYCEPQLNRLDAQPRGAKPRQSPNKRKSYWRHRQRNLSLAGLASTLAQGGNEPVAVLVETVGHAQKLASLLPDWPVIRDTSIPVELPPRCVITLSAAADWREFRPQRLVWASGGEQSHWLAGWLGRMSAAGQSVELFDLEDAFSPEALRLAKARQRSYSSLDCHWRPLPNGVVKAINRFMRNASRHDKQRRTDGRPVGEVTTR